MAAQVLYWLDWIEQAASTGGKLLRRDYLVAAYALAIGGQSGLLKADAFKAANRAIIKRWSPAGLNYIKKEAWRSYKKTLAPDEKNGDRS